ncbi:MAG: right-handed parallel beta-helix repeat-containing protein [Aggregatilineales bacterium]
MRHYSALRSVSALVAVLTAVTVSFAVVRIHSAYAAATWVVTSLADGSGICPSSNNCTLHQAIANALADSGDTITFNLSGTIALSPSPIFLPNITVTLTIDGTGQNVTINGTSADAMFGVSAPGNLTLNHLTVTGANVSGGGGALINSGTVTIQSSTFSSNRAAYGAGVYNSGTVTIQNSTFSSNSAPDGAGVYNTGTVTIQNSIFSGNSSGGFGGSGVYNVSGGTVTIQSSTFSGNGASGSFGGSILNRGWLTVSNSTFGNNTGSQGSVIYNDVGTLNVSGSTFSGNYAYSSDSTGAGAIYNYNSAATISNSTFFGNSSITGSGGGIVNNSTGPLTISNSTFSGNSATTGGAGGGLYNYSGTLNLGSTIIAGNSASSGGPDVSGTITSLGNNLIGNPFGASGFISSDQQNVTPLLNALGNYGGPTQTMSVQLASPAIWHGNCNLGSPAAPVTTDQRGISRKTPCDVGAYETQTYPIDTIGVYRINPSDNNGWWYLRLHNSIGYADFSIQYGYLGLYPVVGAWIGGGIDTIGVYNQANGLFQLRNSNTAGHPDEQFVLAACRRGRLDEAVKC